MVALNAAMPADLGYVPLSDEDAASLESGFYTIDSEGIRLTDERVGTFDHQRTESTIVGRVVRRGIGGSVVADHAVGTLLVRYWPESRWGPKGEPGDVGPGGTDLYYVHRQVAATAEWLVEHHLGKHPSVTIVDTADTVVIGDLEYVDEARLVVRFSAPFSGTAYLN